MIINIIDPGMQTNAGHHADINLRLFKELTGRGHKVRLYANLHYRSNDSEINTIGLTEGQPYEIARSISSAFQSNQQIATLKKEAELFANSLDLVDCADITIFPTLFDYQLFAIGISKCKFGRIFGCLHSPPNLFNTNGLKMWGAAFELIGQKIDTITLGVLEPEVANAFDDLLGDKKIKLWHYPIPHDGSQIRSIEHGLHTVGILGYQRPCKGIELLPQLISNLTQKGLKVIVQNSDPNSNLVNAIDKNQNVQVMGYVQNIGDLITKCSVILLNYDTENYKATGSGIAWEALASGVPILAPAGTTMSKLIEKFSCGCIFDSNNTTSKYNELQFMKEKYKEYKKLAQLASIQYHLIHGTHRFVDFLLSNSFGSPISD